MFFYFQFSKLHDTIRNCTGMVDSTDTQKVIGTTAVKIRVYTQNVVNIGLVKILVIFLIDSTQILVSDSATK